MERPAKQPRLCDSHLRKETPWTSFLKEHDFGPTLAKDRTQSGQRVSVSRNQSHGYQKAADVGSIKPAPSSSLPSPTPSTPTTEAVTGGTAENPVMNMKLWLKANMSQIFTEPKANKPSTLVQPRLVKFENDPSNAQPLHSCSVIESGSSHESHDTSQGTTVAVSTVANSRRGNSPDSPITAQGVLDANGNAPPSHHNHNGVVESNTYKSGFRHARKNSPFEVWTPPQDLSFNKREKQTDEQKNGLVMVKNEMNQMPQPTCAPIISPCNPQTPTSAYVGKPPPYPTLGRRFAGLSNGQIVNEIIGRTQGGHRVDTSAGAYGTFRGGSASHVNRLAAYLVAGGSTIKNNIHPQFPHLQPNPHHHHPQESFSQSHNKSKPKKRCACKKTKCLKLYCPCFAEGAFCGLACNCSDCCNTKAHVDIVLEARANIQAKSPDAFKPKVRLCATGDCGAAHHHHYALQQSSGTASVGTTSGNGSHRGATHGSMSHGGHVMQHQKGCKCVRSNCLKRYCECFAVGVYCGTNCSCSNCFNIPEKIGYSFIGQRE